MLEKYLARTAMAADDRRFLFRPIQSTKNKIFEEFGQDKL